MKADKKISTAVEEFIDRVKLEDLTSHQLESYSKETAKTILSIIEENADTIAAEVKDIDKAREFISSIISKSITLANLATTLSSLNIEDTLIKEEAVNNIIHIKHDIIKLVEKIDPATSKKLHEKLY